MDDEPSTASANFLPFEDDINFASLLRIGSEAIESCEEKIQTWKKQQNEYTNLKESLENLPREISHDVMVPFGNCAFMPGKMIHTNEYLVLLGDNWFVSRSAFQAIKIVVRRLEYVEKELKKLEEEKYFYTQKLKMVEKFEENNDEGVVEIREPLDDFENEEKLMKKSKIEEAAGVLPDADDYAKLMARLDELEKLEELEDERAMNDSDDATTSEISMDNMQMFKYEERSTEKSEHLRYDKPIILDSDDDEQASSSDLSPDSKDINDTLKNLLDKVERSVKSTSNKKFDEISSPVYRKFKKVTWDESSLENLVDCCAESPTDETIPSFVKPEEPEPAAVPPMKSILKNRRESSPVDHNLIREMEDRRASAVIPGSVEAFTGVVCEKPIMLNAVGVSKTQTNSQEPFKRPTSKFRVQRASIQ